MPNTEYVVLAQCKDGDPDACEWTVYDGRTALTKVLAYAERLRTRGFRHVMIRTCGPIVRLGGGS